MKGEKGETLTEAMLAALPGRLRPIRAGKYLRAGCPFHGSEHQRSLSINTETGRFQCFSCGEWGYTEQARDDWKASHARPLYSPPWLRSTGAERLRRDGAEPEPLDNEWLAQLEEWQAALPDAADYLARRRIPIDVAQQMGAGVGWLGGSRRLILPHTDPQGRIVSLYGRRIDSSEDHKHHHLPGRPKGFLNAPATSAAELWITEGAFDALALMAAGIPHACAVFGVSGIRWRWLKSVRRLVLAFDCDEAGLKAITQHARQAAMRSIEVLAVMPEELGGAKDISEAWARGTLMLTEPEAAMRPPADDWVRLVASFPSQAPTGVAPAPWPGFLAQANRFALEHGATARAAGWTALDLFGIPADGSRTAGGAVWLLAEYRIESVLPAEIRARTSRGAPIVVRRQFMGPRRMP